MLLLVGPALVLGAEPESIAIVKPKKLPGAAIPCERIALGDADDCGRRQAVFDRYQALDGPVERVVKSGQDHHPHGLKDVTPVVAFFTTAIENKK